MATPRANPVATIEDQPGAGRRTAAARWAGLRPAPRFFRPGKYAGVASRRISRCASAGVMVFSNQEKERCGSMAGLAFWLRYVCG